MKITTNKRILLNALCSLHQNGVRRLLKTPGIVKELEIKEVESGAYVLYSVPLNKAIQHVIKRIHWDKKDIKKKLLEEDVAAREKFFLGGRDL